MLLSPLCRPPFSFSSPLPPPCSADIFSPTPPPPPPGQPRGMNTHSASITCSSPLGPRLPCAPPSPMCASEMTRPRSIRPMSGGQRLRLLVKHQHPALDARTSSPLSTTPSPPPSGLLCSPSSAKVAVRPPSSPSSSPLLAPLKLPIFGGLLATQANGHTASMALTSSSPSTLRSPFSLSTASPSASSTCRCLSAPSTSRRSSSPWPATG